MDAEWLKTQFKLNPDKTKAELARVLNIDPPAVSKILSGKRLIKAAEYICMREFFDLPVERSNKATHDSYVIEPFLNGLSETASEPEDENWIMPARLLKQRTKTNPEQIKIFNVQENAMAPDFSSGDAVLVDLSAQDPSPPGVFLVSDGMSHLVRRVEYVPHSDPAKVKLSANDQKFSYVMALEKTQIIGRVIAKLQWI